MAWISRPILGMAGAFALIIALAWASVDLTSLSSVQADPAVGADIDTIEISEELRNPDNPKALLVDGVESVAPQSSAAAAEEEAAAAAVGEQATWVALHDAGGFYYTKVFELRAENDVGEVWIAVGEGLDPNGDPDGVMGLDFPAGDCRNDGMRNIVTDAQAEYLLEEFTNNIKATDEAWFGEPDFRDGSAGLLPRLSPEGKQVVLIDNVRDDNFYDTNNATTLPYIAGFFTSAMDFFHNRNVMSIDGFDWLHRTGADPAHAPSADPCTSAVARPFLYEGVFAHEYQHLIHNDYDPDELNWVNEGMSDLAILLTGYSDPSLHVDEKGNDNHVLSFQGWAAVEHPEWNPIPRAAGPENSLTVWEDQGPVEVLEDYGVAYLFMVYLYDQGYGQDFFLAWHHNPLNGIEGLNDTLASAESSSARARGGSNGHRFWLPRFPWHRGFPWYPGFPGHGHGHDDGGPPTFEALFNDFKVMVLVDGYIDRGAKVKGDSDKAALQSDSLNSTIHITPDAYDTPGAPPWGSDYLPLGPGKKFNNLTFDGQDLFTFPGGNDWTIDADGYWTSPDEPGDTVYPNDLDSSIAREISVPAGAATLTFEHWYQTELDWDFAFVQVMSDDGFVSLPCTGTTTDHDPGAVANIVAQLPGYSGPTQDPSDPATSGTPAAPLAASCDLSAYAGQDVVLAFRMMSDPAVQFDGWHIRNVAINDTPVDPTPGDLSDWDNEPFFQPVGLAFMLTFVGIDGKIDQYGHVTKAGKVTVVDAHLKAGSRYKLSNNDRNALAQSDYVYAIITGVPSDESAGLYFPYSLKIRGQERADGAHLP